MGDLSDDEKRKLLEFEVKGYRFYSYNDLPEGELKTPWGQSFSTHKLDEIFNRKLKFGDREQIDLSDAKEFIDLLIKRDYLP